MDMSLHSPPAAESSLSSSIPTPAEPAAPSGGSPLEAPHPEPKFALRSDGALLLLVDEHLTTVDLSDYTLSTFIVLRPDQVGFVKASLINGEQETAAKLAGMLMRRPT